MAFSPIQNLAQRVLAFEAAHNNSSGVRADVVVQVIGKLRQRLVRLAGVDGFRSLLSRALTLARAEAPSLNLVQVRADGFLEGFDVIEQNHEAGMAGQAGIVLVAQLLELLITFIGEPLTLRLVHDVWPDAPTTMTDLRSEEKL